MRPCHWVPKLCRWPSASVVARAGARWLVLHFSFGLPNQVPAHTPHRAQQHQSRSAAGLPPIATSPRPAWPHTPPHARPAARHTTRPHRIRPQRLPLLAPVALTRSAHQDAARLLLQPPQCSAPRDRPSHPTSCPMPGPLPATQRGLTGFALSARPSWPRRLDSLCTPGCRPPFASASSVLCPQGPPVASSKSAGILGGPLPPSLPELEPTGRCCIFFRPPRPGARTHASQGPATSVALGCRPPSDRH
jgi:hypothetical protein